MKGSARLRVDAIDGTAFAVDVRSEPPFAIRRAGGRFVIVGVAATPVRGDELELVIEVAAGAAADIGTVAATMVWPGTHGTGSPPSRLTTTISVGAGAHLRWWPEPTVSVIGSDHVACTIVELARGATCEIVEEWSLGRHGESSGNLVTELRVVRDGRPLVHHSERFGPGSSGAGTVARVGAARHVLTAVLVGREACPSAGESAVEVSGAPAGVSAAWLPVAPDAAVVLGVGPERPAVLDAVERIRVIARTGATEPARRR